jgi:hypothetical protein
MGTGLGSPLGGGDDAGLDHVQPLRKSGDLLIAPETVEGFCQRRVGQDGAGIAQVGVEVGGLALG